MATHGTEWGKVLVAADVDVAVVGGGGAGCSAAVAAARNGARVVLIERYGSLGGCMGPGGWAAGALDLAILDPHRFSVGKDEDKFSNGSNHWISTKHADPIAEDIRNHVIGCGLAGEWMARLFDLYEKIGPCPHFGNQAIRVEYLFNQMLQESGVQQMLQTYAADPILSAEGVVGGLYVENVSGRQAVRAKVTIDCTGNAAFAQRAGAPIVLPNRQPSMNITFSIANIDSKKFEKFIADRPPISRECNQWVDEVLIPDVDYVAGRLGAHITRLSPFADLVRRAWEDDGYQAVGWIGDVGRICMAFPVSGPKDGMLWDRADIDGDVDTLNAEHMTMLERDGRKYVFDTLLFMRKYFPGFDNAYLMYLSPYIGTRGGRAIEAEYIVTKQDLIDGRRHADVIHQTYDLRDAHNFADVPYRQLLPQKVEGLLAAGVAAHQKPPNLRCREGVMTMGEAAGIAAAICAKQGVMPRDIDIKALQRVLRKSGVNLGTPGRVAALGL